MTAPFTYRPGSLLNLDDERLRKELDNAVPRIYDAHNALRGAAIQAPALNQGFNVQSGTTTVTGSKLGIATGLATVVRVTASQDSGATATNFTVSASPSKGTRGAIDIYVWQPTAAGNTTPIAATSAVTVHWWATGSTT